MIDATYGVIEEKYTVGNHSRISYGIAAYADIEHNGTAIVVASVNDITSDRERITQLVDDCNRLNLSLIHLNDVVEDFFVVNT